MVANLIISQAVRAWNRCRAELMWLSRLSLRQMSIVPVTYRISRSEAGRALLLMLAWPPGTLETARSKTPAGGLEYKGPRSFPGLVEPHPGFGSTLSCNFEVDFSSSCCYLLCMLARSRISLATSCPGVVLMKDSRHSMGLGNAQSSAWQW